MVARDFQPGFRLSAIDGLVLAGAAIISLLAGSMVWWTGAVIALVFGHFFLFCNVFRIIRPAELVWAVVFLALVGGTVALGFPGWTAAIGGSLTASLFFILVEMRKPSYHGVLWRRINPALPQWWAEQNDRRE